MPYYVSQSKQYRDLCEIINSQLVSLIDYPN